MVYPAPGNILIEIVEIEEKTPEGLYVGQDSIGKQVKYGKVKEIGLPKILEGGMVSDVPQFKINDMNHKLISGDIVVFKQHSANDIGDYTKTEELALLSFESILGIKQ